MLSKRLTEFSSGIIVFLMSALPVAAGGLEGSVDAPDLGKVKFGDLPTAITSIFNFVIIISAVIFIILFLVGGVQYLTAAGNEEQTGKAKRLLVDAIVGLVIVLAAWAAGNFIINQLIGNVPLS